MDEDGNATTTSIPVSANEGIARDAHFIILYGVFEAGFT